MNKLTREKQAQVVAALVEGTSVNATVRMTGVAKNTILKLLADLGTACIEYQDKALRNLSCKRIQCDEIWQFCYAKEKNVPEEKRGQFGYGDVWTWVAIDADTKLVPAFALGKRPRVFQSIEPLILTRASVHPCQSNSRHKLAAMVALFPPSLRMDTMRLKSLNSRCGDARAEYLEAAYWINSRTLRSSVVSASAMSFVMAKI